MKNYFKNIFVLILASAAIHTNAATPSQKSSNDRVEFVNVNQMPRPIPASELKIMQQKKMTSSAKSADGISPIENSPEMVKSFFNNVDIAKKQVESNSIKSSQTMREDVLGTSSEARQDLSSLKLTFKPAVFNRGRLVAAAPSGTVVKNSWTGIERYYQIDGVGVVRITELDLGSTNGKFYMLKESINTKVNGKQAISKIYQGANNQKLEEVVWVNGNKMYIFSLGKAESSTSAQAKSMVISPISALSMAQEIR